MNTGNVWRFYPLQSRKYPYTPCMKFSCIIPAYNEWSRIGKVLEVILTCDDLSEVIVINDGSTDTTRECIDRFTHPKLKSILLPKNGGKLKAFFEGIRLAQGSHIVMMDADYSGFTKEHMSRLITPVREKKVDSTMMMWHESLLLCKILKHDIFSGARVLPKSIFDNTDYYLSGYGYWLEAKLNEILYQRKLSVLSLYFPDVHNPSKGSSQLIRQFHEIIKSVPFWKIIRQAWYFYRQQP